MLVFSRSFGLFRYFLNGLVVFLLIGQSELSAQLENHIWFFGQNTTGIQFDPVTNQPGPLNVQYTPFGVEGCGVVTDPVTGQLLFYSDGASIIDRNHQVMTNGGGLGGCPSSAQAVAMTPVPGSCNQYYVYTNETGSSCPTTALRYSIVDMNANGGLGDVPAATRNVLLNNFIREGMIAVPRAGTEDYWVIGSTSNPQNNYVVYRVNASGVTLAGNYPLGTCTYTYNLNYSAQAGKVAFACPTGGNIFTIDFDDQTGVLSNYVVIGNIPSAYETQWSPDGTKLYYSSWTVVEIRQYDLLNGVTTSLWSSGGQAMQGGGMRIGPDGLIYHIADLSSNFLSRIYSPNAAGLACDYRFNDYDAQGRIGGLNLPEVLAGTDVRLTLALDSTDVTCHGFSDGTIVVTADSGVAPYTYQWNTGDTTAILNGREADLYSVTVTDVNNCSNAISGEIAQPDSLSFTKDSVNVSCNGASDGSIFLNASGGALPHSFSWSNGESTSFIINLSGGTYVSTISDNNNCSVTSSTTITESNAIVSQITSSGCGDIDLILTGGEPPYAILWSNGAVSEDQYGVAQGNYRVTITDAASCSHQDSVLVQYQYDSTLFCSFRPDTNQTQLQPAIEWQSQADVGSYPCTVVGDIDADGIPEVITYRVGSNQFFCIDGATGVTEWQQSTPSSLNDGMGPAIADLDNDGFGEIVISGDARIIRCYEHDGTLKFSSTQQVGYGTQYNHPIYSIADVNGDGFGEIHIGNQIFSGQNGDLLASGGPGLAQGSHPSRGMEFSSAVVADALPDNFCADCSGLEIIAGNQVLSVNITTGQVLVQVQVAGGFTDGFTAIADFDLDGDLDGIIQGQLNGRNTTYVWDLQTPNLVRPAFDVNVNAPGAVARPNVADLDGDGELEVSFCANSQFIALDNDFSVLWQNAINDPSGVTVSSVFDFVGDGSYEVVYRDNQNLQIYDGSTGATVWSQPCGSGTHIENPLIVDVDADGETEIVITCGSGSSGNVTAFGSASFLWLPSRPVWNQHGYFNVHINDDLSIPAQQLPHHLLGDQLIMNNFLNQRPPIDCRYRPVYPAADALVASLNFYNGNCSNGSADSVTVVFEICNQGLKRLPVDVPIAFYNGDPTSTAADLFTVYNTIGAIDTASCLIDSITIAVPDSSFELFVMTNDTGFQAANLPFLISSFPITSTGECDFQNNLFSTTIPRFRAELDSQDVRCFGGTDGMAYVDVLDGAGNYTFSWSNGTPTADFDTVAGLSAGFVSIMVVDRQGCAVYHDSIEINQPDLLVIDSVVSQMSCPNAPDAEIAIPTIGGLRPYSYNWSHDATITDSLVTSLDQGTYAVAVTDRNNCADSITQIIVNSPAFSMQLSGYDTRCANQASGMAVATISSTSGPFNFNWSSGLANSTGDTVRQLSAQMVSVTVSDLAGCLFAVDSVLVNDAAPLVLDTQVTQLSCPFGSDASIEVIATGGTDSYTYSWQHDSTLSDSIANQLAEGVYSVTVTDQNSCTDSVTGIAITDISFEMRIDSFDAPCFGEAGGSASVEILDGPLNVNFSWSSGIPQGPGDSVSALFAGRVSVTVSDQNNCYLDSGSTQINQATELVANHVFAELSCPFADDGSISIQTNGGTPAYNFQWSHDPTLTDSMATNLSPGNYSVSVFDSNACLDTIQSIRIAWPAPVGSIGAAQTPVSCFGGTDGAIDLTVSANAPHSINWSTGDQSEDLDSLSAGAYQVEVFDSSGCFVDSLRIQLTQPDSLTASVSGDSSQCAGIAEGALQLSPGGGVAPITNQWSTGSTAFNLIDLAAGTYSFTLTDFNSCILIDSFQIAETPNPIADAGLDTAICIGEFAEIGANPAASGGTGLIGYSWSPTVGLNSPVQANPLAGPPQSVHFVLEIVDEKGCVDSDTVYVQVDPRPLIALPPDTAICPDGLLNVFVSGSPGLNYVWSTGETGDSIQLQPGFPLTLGITATDSLTNCSSTDLMEIDMSRPQIEVVPADTTILSGETVQLGIDGFAPVSVTWTPATWLDDAEIENPIASPEETITYSVYAVSEEGCVVFNSGQIEVINLPDQVLIPSGFTPNGDGRNDLFQVFLRGDIELNTMMVFNRWGEKVFSYPERTAFPQWDGTYKDENQPLAVYTYYVKVKNTKSGKVTDHSGTVTLVR